MKRETKVGLLVGMGVILLIGIILSDHLSVVQQQRPAGQMSNFAPTADRGIGGDGTVADPGAISDVNNNQAAPLPAQARQIVQVPEPGESPKPAPAPVAPDTNTPKVANTPAPGIPGTPGAPGQNVAPPAPEQLQVAVANPPSPAKNVNIHIVKHGDTLYKLAMISYGNGSKWDLIQKANPDVGPDGQLHEGQKLVIPADGVPEEMKKSGMFEPVNPANTPGISEVPSKTTAGGYNVVQVEEGETLATIAKEHLGSAQRWKEILDLNKNQLKRPQDLQVGMKLRLPSTSTKTTAAVDTDATVSPAVVTPHTTTAAKTTLVKPTPATPVAAAAGLRTYTVQPGDSLASIAAKQLGNRSRWELLLKANRKLLNSPADLKIGQVLILPAIPGR